jgi:hypothetical protein
MTISLPTDPSPTAGTPLLRDFGGVLTPFLGGPEQRINRVGTRFGVRIVMPPLTTADRARLVISRLLQARQDRLLMKWPMMQFDPGTPGSPLIAANVASGSAISIKGLTAGYQAKEGQFFSVIHSSRRYIHMFTGDGTADGSGNLAINIFPMLRTNLSINDVVEIAQPMIEGHVLPGDELSWNISAEKFASIEFSVMEAA